MNTKQNIFGLCEARHPMPVEKYIFPNSIADPTDVEGLERTARESLAGIDDGDSIVIYVSGLTVALISVLNVCRDRNIEVTLMHFDIKSNNYYEQKVR